MAQQKLSLLTLSTMSNCLSYAFSDTAHGVVMATEAGSGVSVTLVSAKRCLSGY